MIRNILSIVTQWTLFCRSGNPECIVYIVKKVTVYIAPGNRSWETVQRISKVKVYAEPFRGLNRTPVGWGWIRIRRLDSSELGVRQVFSDRVKHRIIRLLWQAKIWKMFASWWQNEVSTQYLVIIWPAALFLLSNSVQLSQQLSRVPSSGLQYKQYRKPLQHACTLPVKGSESLSQPWG